MEEDITLSKVIICCDCYKTACFVESHFKDFKETYSNGVSHRLTLECGQEALLQLDSKATTGCSATVTFTEPRCRGNVDLRTAVLVHVCGGITNHHLLRTGLGPPKKAKHRKSSCQKQCTVAVTTVRELLLCIDALHLIGFMFCALFRRQRRRVDSSILRKQMLNITQDAVLNLDNIYFKPIVLEEVLPPVTSAIKLKPEWHDQNTVWLSPLVYHQFFASTDVPPVAHIELIDTRTGLNVSRRVASVGYFCNNVLRKPTFDYSSALLSSVLWFNMLSAVQISVLNKNCVFSIKVNRHSGKRPVANSVQLSLVNTSVFNENTDLSEELLNFFSRTRIMCPGDLFFVTVSGEETRRTLAIDNLPVKRAWLRVNKLESSTDTGVSTTAFIVNRSLSSVFQVSSSISQVAPIIDQAVFSECLLPYCEEIKNLTLLKLNRVGFSTAACLLISGPSGCGKSRLVHMASLKCGFHLLEMDCCDLWAEAAGSSEAKINNIFLNTKSLAPVVLHLKHIDILGKELTTGDYDLRVLNCLKQALTDVSAMSVIVIGTTTKAKELRSELVTLFPFHLKLQNCIDKEARQILLSQNNISCTNELMNSTAAFVMADLESLINEAKLACISRMQKNALPSRSIGLLSCDVDQALSKLSSAQDSSFGLPKVPAVHWDDIGGLEDAKAAVIDMVQLSLQHPHLFSSGMTRSGILLHGPPGCGKTLLAKAIATECSLMFLCVNGPELLNSFVGQSEQNIREVFVKARMVAPCVIFFDELDSLAPNRGRNGDSAGVMDRVVSQLLAELDGMHKNANVFVIGATNRPDLIDSAVLRPGRFDKLIYVGIKNDVESRLKVLSAICKRLKLNSDVDLRSVLEYCSPNMSGADFYAVCACALTRAVNRLIQEGVKLDAACQVQVIQQDFMDALTEHNF